jgi:plastocyanin
MKEDKQKNLSTMLAQYTTLSLLVSVALCATVTITAITSSSVSFSPISININVGDTVVWTGLNTHNVAEVASNNDTVYMAGGFRSGNQGVVPVFQKEFDAATVGANTTYYYICEPHIKRGMRGVINIVAATPTPKPTNSAPYYSGLTMCFLVSLIGVILVY